MQKTNIQSLRLVSAKFSDFCRKSSRLPALAPLFMIDQRGRVVAKKNFSRLSRGFESVINYIPAGDFDSFAARMGKSDFCAVKCKEEIDKGYIAVSKEGGGLSGCAVCSLSEKGCKKLTDYFGHLCSYRDYLDGFSLKSASDSTLISAKEAFDSRINGIGYLMNLSLSPKEQKSKVSLPAFSIFDKIRSFAERINQTSERLCQISVDGDNPPVSIPIGFISGAVSCLGLVLRNSSDGRARVHISSQNNDVALVRIECNGRRLGNEDIYTNAVIDAAGVFCQKAVFGKTPDGLFVELFVERAKDESLVVSEPAELDRRLTLALDVDGVFDMFLAITDV